MHDSGREGREGHQNAVNTLMKVSKRDLPQNTSERALRALSEKTPMKSPLRILLSDAVTRHLEAMGKECFLVIAKDKSDQHSGRMVIHLIPTTYNLANAGLRVAQGTSTEKRPRPAPEPSPAALTPAEIRMA